MDLFAFPNNRQFKCNEPQFNIPKQVRLLSKIGAKLAQIQLGVVQNQTAFEKHYKTILL